MNYAENGRLYVTASADGDVKIWDGVSNRCIETFQRAHDGFDVSSAVFTRNGKVRENVFSVCLNYDGHTMDIQYVLSAGKDSWVKLWELAANRCLIAYTGAGATGAQEYRLPAGFNHTEDYGRSK